MLTSLIAIVAFQWPLAVFVIFNSVTAVYFTAAVCFRFYLLALGWDDKIDAAPLHILHDEDLPVITILLPLYKDATALPLLACYVDRLDYPEHKKDVKLLLEEDDLGTTEEALRLGLAERYEMIIVPPCEPRTKPKACNVGLQMARGELIVIYDAEDQPEADQLRKAAAAFHAREETLACVQARLNYFNHDENWLTRLFTLEYSLWFDWLLPALQKMGAPIPLGGTSNFFRTETLRAVGGWDPYNVTEDADLGLRLARLGYSVEVIGSTTFEEANCKTGNWLRQRSRWLKGYVQTWLVHMRRPQRIIATTGWRGFLAVQLFVAGNVFSAIINPIMWGLFLFWTFARPQTLQGLLPAPLVWLNLFALVAGNFVFILTMAIGPLKRGWRGLAPFALTAPAYWLLSSLAAYKALWQAVFRPHYWEKTDHVISAAARKRREAALAAHFSDEPFYDRRSPDIAERSIPDSDGSRRAALSENERARQRIHHS
ncbi:glycosyltransferase family 2 protein [Hyphococcus sp.]|uniref:glycosyltransferase family 2 protein n=1 Tax=Hyphococcus sp. TaxID=2038636 RepID=UPI003D141529